MCATTLLLEPWAFKSHQLITDKECIYIYIYIYIIIIIKPPHIYIFVRPHFTLSVKSKSVLLYLPLSKSSLSLYLSLSLRACMHFGACNHAPRYFPDSTVSYQISHWSSSIPRCRTVHHILSWYCQIFQFLNVFKIHRLAFCGYSSLQCPFRSTSASLPCWYPNERLLSDVLIILS
jgi:hypothetical protein